MAPRHDRSTKIHPRPRTASTLRVPAASLRFPSHFLWGVATSAPQIEGAASVDGKGESVWDRFASQPGRVAGGGKLDPACEHYWRYRDDAALMQSLGVRHYRLSIAWPRIYPQGDGALNQGGLDYYSSLVDTLLCHGIQPWVTLFHWDLPQALEDRGGWRNRLVVDAFARYADTVVRALGDRVKHWFTLNEIVCFTGQAYGTGEKAPGVRESAKIVNQTHHHALVCHGHAVRAVREHGGSHARVGLADNPDIPIPVTETAHDIAAARRLFIEGSHRTLDPIYRGQYATAYLRAAGADRPVPVRGDFDLISLPTDFLGLNIYRGYFARAGSRGRPEAIPFPPDYPCTANSWLLHTPQSMYWGCRYVAEIYGVQSIYITENGASFESDTPNSGGEVLDLHRRDHVRSYLCELHRAIADRVPVHGYFWWSFMDNFEWHDGYPKRFGLVHVDFATQKRTPKLSASWYSEVMRANVIL